MNPCARRSRLRIGNRSVQSRSRIAAAVTTQGCLAAATMATPSTTLAPMADLIRWEYATAPLLIHATQQILNNWGTDGWELVQVVPGPNAEQLVAYFKRPVS